MMRCPDGDTFAYLTQAGRITVSIKPSLSEQIHLRTRPCSRQKSIYFLRYNTSSEVNKFPPYVLLTMRVGGVGDLATVFRFITKLDAGAAEGCYIEQISA